MPSVLTAVAKRREGDCVADKVSQGMWMFWFASGLVPFSLIPLAYGSRMALSQPELTPAQVAVLDALGSTPSGRPTFADDLGPRLRAELEASLAPAVPAMDAIGL